MKKSRWNIYSILKDWTRSPIQVREPLSNDPALSIQAINLEPFFETQSHAFRGVFCSAFLNAQSDQLEILLKEHIDHIHYWHCHNQAIRCVIPMSSQAVFNRQTLDQICNLIQASELPVGLIAIAVHDVHNYPDIYPSLEILKRLGIELDLFNFTGMSQEFEGLENFSFDGIHISAGFFRASKLTKEHTNLLEKIDLYQNLYKFHIYFRGIALVHDFVFAKKHGFHFSYGPLMMPAVSKHQILKIKESQFANMPLISTPSPKPQDG